MQTLAMYPHTDRRQHPRVPVDLSCQVNFSDRMAHGRLRDLSLGGARVEMPLHVAAYTFDRLTSLHMRNIGLVRVRWRWSRDHLVGMEFLSPEAIRQALSRFLVEQTPPEGIRPTDG